MTTLSAQGPRRFHAARLPSYPRVAVLGLVMSGAACQPAGSMAPPPATSDRPAASAQAPAPTVLVLAAPPPSPVSGVPEVAAPPPDGAAPRFPEDDLALDIVNAQCKGDCASPFEMAAFRKDEAQVQARVNYCARSSPGEGSATLRGKVGKDGRVKQLSFDKADVAPPGALLECVLKLVSEGRFTPPDGSDERGIYVTFRLPSR